MDQFGQTNNNDLQKAIDEISGGNDGAIAPAEPAGDNVQVNVNLGEPPVPPTTDFGMPPMDGATVNPPEPAMSDLDRMTSPAPEPEEPAATPASDMAPASGMAPTGDLAAVRETALKELVPIIDKAGLSADRQFGIIAAVIDSTKDKAFIPKALEAARAIPDEKLRAEALLKIVGFIDR